MAAPPSFIYTPTKTVTTTATTANLTAVAIHTFDSSHVSASISWVAGTETTYLAQYVIGETDEAGNFRSDRPIETWRPHADIIPNQFSEPGATNDFLYCVDQNPSTLPSAPTGTPTLGYAIQDCTQMHVMSGSILPTQTGITTITPVPVTTLTNVGVTTSTMYKDNLHEMGYKYINLVTTRIIAGVVVTVVVLLLGGFITWRKRTKGYVFKKPNGQEPLKSGSGSLEEGKVEPDNGQIFYPPQQIYYPPAQGYDPTLPGPPSQGYYSAPPPVPSHGYPVPSPVAPAQEK
ncbi:hypothetical protein DL96DRAFT_554597 [Flagelloscypha sp. PMI_526]|nr:hypothetical protein DL96DRAFT_554597 [Flagelloscypha sp. PMI_526]